ncbi:serine/threonine protein kinase, partial [Streptomyces sp. B1866]|uniref:protein kinase n=1 Tax=Streptomyces sp. B1866 TaxID=3075431 RepID=UPI00288E5C40|nr:serine/threonine protein kinase [Streptomyces sp. B1866]
MDEYAGRVLAGRYRLPLPPADEYELIETRAYDTHSRQEVHLRQIPLPEVVDAELVDEDSPYGGPGPQTGAGRGRGRDLNDPAVRRALAAADAAARLPDHPRLDQVFHVFVEAGSLWIASELVDARPLAALLAERPLPPHRAAEVAADILTALRGLHAHGWIHGNITARTVLVCEDGRAMLTGLAAGAAEEALCGYDPVPDPAARAEGLESAIAESLAAEEAEEARLAARAGAHEWAEAAEDAEWASARGDGEWASARGDGERASAPGDAGWGEAAAEPGWAEATDGSEWTEDADGSEWADGPQGSEWAVEDGGAGEPGWRRGAREERGPDLPPPSVPPYAGGAYAGASPYGPGKVPSPRDGGDPPGPVAPPARGGPEPGARPRAQSVYRDQGAAGGFPVPGRTGG